MEQSSLADAVRRAMEGASPIVRPTFSGTVNTIVSPQDAKRGRAATWTAA